MGDVGLNPNPFERVHSLSSAWHESFDATFVITACILMLTALVLYVAHRYRRTWVRVWVRTIVFHDSSDVPHNTEECGISLYNFVVGDQVASL